MANTHETIADIIAWLRKPIEGENAYLTLWRDEIADRLDAAKLRERGDAAKLREALAKILWCLEWMFNNTDDKSVQSHLGKPIALAKSALAAPARNCDVGTAREQLERFGKFCHANINMEGCGGDCPAFRTTRNDCELVWAQMPYEEGGDK